MPTSAPPVSPADGQLKVWMSKYGWSADESGQIFICSQEESIKPKNIVEKIDFDSEWGLEASGCGAQDMLSSLALQVRTRVRGTCLLTPWVSSAPSSVIQVF